MKKPKKALKKHAPTEASLAYGRFVSAGLAALLLLPEPGRQRMMREFTRFLERFNDAARVQ
jgi:hypothetical protein